MTLSKILLVTGHVLPLKIAPSHVGSAPHLIRGSLAPADSATQMSSGQVQLQLTPQTLYFTVGAPFPKIVCSHGDQDPHLTRDSYGPSEPTTKTASRLVEPFLHR